MSGRVHGQIDRVGPKPAAIDSQELAYRYIKDRILDQRFSTRKKLRTQELAEAISLSRTPVREALGRLAQEGLVVREDGWGFTVRSMTFQEVLDLFSVRELLEIEAAKKAVPNCSEGDIIRLSAMLEKSRVALEKGKSIESIRLARIFHTALAELAGNRLLLDMLKGINERIHMVGLTILRQYPERPLRVLEENHRILSALRARDSNALELALREHIARSRELIVNGRWEQQVT